eukprot:CAMPEP_0185751780 /NCGR_PEP_ID=MMETSP1174-20130828/10564_1 /TAXON_ID=35687 /ORGANISM="Dictyocha speculum, Strain CCMP1381" /LENGTH=345 /DNA_ID=CAMNT_0028428925 /DNA_START=24 /DNA_END=1061 /DNA_ORIENTATION=+
MAEMFMNAARDDGEVQKVAVLGSGAFGTAMATVAARNGHSVYMYARDPAVVASVNEQHKNPRYVKEFTLPVNLVATQSIEEACQGAKLIMLAIPAQKLPGFLEENRDIIPSDVILCSTAKGLYLKDKCLLSSAMLASLDRIQPLAFLSGPSFAAEIMKGNPTLVVVASKYLYHAAAVQRWLSTADFRVYTSQDTVGVELGGSLKNPLAVGAGFIEGLGLGVNTMAAFVTRSSGELQMLCQAMGGEADTISGLSGIGDLMLTAFGDLSRNRTCGMRLARGEKLEDILATTTVEGVPTAEVAVHFATLCNIDCPIFQTVAEILNGSLSPEAARNMLMNRPLGMERKH